MLAVYYGVCALYSHASGSNPDLRLTPKKSYNFLFINYLLLYGTLESVPTAKSIEADYFILRTFAHERHPPSPRLRWAGEKALK